MYILTGVVNWRDYQEKVDWGVVWLHAGAIIFGTVLDLRLPHKTLRR